jgi:hypothetical protein
MELTEKQLKQDIEVAILVRDKKCDTLEQKDALARLINFTETTINLLKEKQ